MESIACSIQFGIQTEYSWPREPSMPIKTSMPSPPATSCYPINDQPKGQKSASGYKKEGKCVLKHWFTDELPQSNKKKKAIIFSLLWFFFIFRLFGPSFLQKRRKIAYSFITVTSSGNIFFLVPPNQSGEGRGRKSDGPNSCDPLQTGNHHHCLVYVSELRAATRLPHIYDYLWYKESDNQPSNCIEQSTGEAKALPPSPRIKDT